MDYKEYEKLNFNSVYKMKGYPKKIWPILNEYFSRYKHELDLNQKEIEEKLLVVINNLDTIDFKEKTTEKYAGIYRVKAKHIDIILNEKEKSNMKYEDILNVIFHELNHAGENQNYEDCTSFEKYNYRTESYEGVALNEIITEMKSSRLARNDRTDLVKKGGRYLNLQSYGDLIFIGTMIHTTLGISEKDFLKYADMGRDEFDKVMASKFPSEEDYNSFMDNIIFHSDALHRIKYNRDDSSKPYTNEELLNIYNCIKGIYNRCLYEMARIIPYQAYMNRNDIDMKEYMTKCRFDIEKIKSNYKHGLSYMFETDDRRHYECYCLTDLQNAIIAIESIEMSKNKLSNEEYDNLLKKLLMYNLTTDEYLNNMYVNYGIKPRSDMYDFDRTTDLSYEMKILNSEYGDLSWNNENCKIYIDNAINKENIFTKLFNRVKNVIGKKPTYKLLLEPQSSVNTTTKYSDELEKLRELVVDEPNNNNSCKINENPTIEYDER